MSLAMPETDPNVTPRRLLVLAVPAILVGVLSAVILWSLEQAADLLGGVLWSTLPDSASFRSTWDSLRRSPSRQRRSKA